MFVQGFKYAQAAIYCQYNCQQLLFSACHALHAVSASAKDPNEVSRLGERLTDLLTDVNETVAVYSEPGWLLRLEGPVDDDSQMSKLHAALTSVARAAGTAGPGQVPASNLAADIARLGTADAAGAEKDSNSNSQSGSAGSAGTAGSAQLRARGSFKLQEQQAAGTADTPQLCARESFKSQGQAAGTAGADELNVQSMPKPVWSDDSDALRGRLLELGGVSGLQTDTDCLLLKDFCRPGIEDNAFLDLVDLELQVSATSVRPNYLVKCNCCRHAAYAVAMSVDSPYMQISTADSAIITQHLCYRS